MLWNHFGQLKPSCPQLFSTRFLGSEPSQNEGIPPYHSISNDISCLKSNTPSRNEILTVIGIK